MAADPAAGDWAYHGTYQKNGDRKTARIFVVPADVTQPLFEKFGTAGGSRDTPDDALRELSAEGGFLWGYAGDSPARTAEAVLADALELPDLNGLRRQVSRGNQADSEQSLLRRDFVYDVVSQLGYEWRLRRGTILRWVRGWYAEHGLDGVPDAVLNCPPADLHLRETEAW